MIDKSASRHIRIQTFRNLTRRGKTDEQIFLEMIPYVESSILHFGRGRQIPCVVIFPGLYSWPCQSAGWTN